jgi:Zn-dependent protease with chaperone function
MRLVLLLLAVAAPAIGQEGVNFYSLSQERDLGQRFAKGLVNALQAHLDPRLEVAGTSLLAHLRDTHEFSFFAFDVSRPNEPLPEEVFAFPADWRTLRREEAIALPGGGIFVSRSLMERASAMDELAAILAHAIGHVVLRHPTQMATRIALLDNGPMPNMAPTPVAGLMEFAQAWEIAADRYAARLLKDAGFDPHALERYIQSLPEPAPTPRNLIFSPHPPREERIDAIEKAIAEFR